MEIGRLNIHLSGIELVVKQLILVDVSLPLKLSQEVSLSHTLSCQTSSWHFESVYTIQLRRSSPMSNQLIYEG